MRIIAGEARGRRIEAPEGRNTRPTLDRIRENMFNILQTDIPGSHVLDLFAGSGALSFEAVSRGAADAVLVDSDRKANAVQKRNMETLRYEDRIRLLYCDWTRAVQILSEERKFFDMVFLDPPYAMTDLKKVFTGLIPLIGNETLIVLEHEAGKEIIVPEAFSTIKERSWGYCAMTVYQMKTGGN